MARNAVLAGNVVHEILMRRRVLQVLALGGASGGIFSACHEPLAPPDPAQSSGGAHDVPDPSLGGQISGEGGLGGDSAGTAAYDWDLPPGFPRPWEPEDNPTTQEKVELGRHLFYDERLSQNETMSCASCHRQELAFTDGKTTALGSTGEAHPRNSMSLTNVGYNATLTWAHPLMYELERQAIVPMFGTEPVELGLKDADEIEERLAEDPTYRDLFAAAYPNDAELGTLQQMTRALAAFQRTLISGNSPYDRFIQGIDENAISQSAQRGYKLFHSEKLECFHCHVGFNLSDHTYWADKPFFDAPFHNTGLYNIDGKGGFPEPNTGVHSITLDPKDMGRFRAPSLRNVAVTAPYMHDGSIATLSEVLDHYAAAGRTIAHGEYVGDGSENPYKSSLIIGFELSEQERADVLAFLESLTDQKFLENPAFSDPW